MAPMFRNHQKGPFQDGVTDLGYRLTHRYINMSLFFSETSYATADDARDLATHIFKPRAVDPLVLTVIRADGAQRSIACNVDSIMDYPDTHGDRMGFSQKFVVGLKCHDPVFYDPVLKQYMFQGILQGAGGSQVPIDMNWVQTGDVQIEVIEDIFYEGDWLTYPEIIIHGPGDNTSIQNLTTGETLDFTHTLDSDDIRYINLNYGHKTVLDQNGDSALSELSEESDLATFHIAADPEAPGGINQFLISMDNREAASSYVLMYFYNRYLSL